MIENEENSPVLGLTYGGTTLPDSQNPPQSYRDRVESLRALSHSRQAAAQAKGRFVFQDTCPMSDCRYTNG